MKKLFGWGFVFFSLFMLGVGTVWLEPFDRTSKFVINGTAFVLTLILGAVLAIPFLRYKGAKLLGMIYFFLLAYVFTKLFQAGVVVAFFESMVHHPSVFFITVGWVIWAIPLAREVVWTNNSLRQG